MEVYTSLPLPSDRPSFRLLELDLSCGEEEAAIHATMRNFNFNNAPEYEALSYTWGTEKNSEVILLNGRWIPVTSNLHAALQQIRCSQMENLNAARKLWIDAVCINQSDNIEKSEHVMRMKEIYSKASRVLIWTCSAGLSSGLAIDTLQRFAVKDNTGGGPTLFKDIPNTAEERMIAVQRFLECSYFTRVWVIQEVVVAANAVVLCGPLSLNFDSLHTAIERLTGSGLLPLSALTTNVTYVGDWRAHFLRRAPPGVSDGIDLRFFLDSRDRNATDPRDKIYALRGLITNDEFAEGIKVDYAKSVERVYTDFSKHLLTISLDLRILSTVILRHRTTTTLKLPSWVPDWSQPKYGGGILQRYYRFAPDRLFRAAATSTPRVHVAEDSDTVSVEGIHLDTVERVVPIKSILNARNSNSCFVDATILHKLSGDITSQTAYPFTSEPSWAAVFRTLTADRTALSPRIHAEYRAKFLSRFNDFELNDSGVPHNLPEQAWAEISKGIGAIIEDKDMFVTTSGRLGLSQEGFAIGDVVCVFCGGEVPFMLRPRSHDEKFEFLSECYVHGAMDGEALQNREPHQLKSFVLE